MRPISINRPIATTIILLPLAVLISGLAAAPLLILVGLWMAALAHSHKLDMRPQANEAWIMLALIAWGGCSVLLSPVNRIMEEGESWVRIAMTFGIGFYILFFTHQMLPKRHMRTLLRAAKAGLFFALILALTSLKDGGVVAWLDATFSPGTKFKMHDMNRGAVVLAIFFWPAIYGYAQNARSRAPVLGMTLLLFFTLTQLDSATACIALLAGLSVYCTQYFLKFERSFFFVSLGLACLFIVLPVGVYFFLDIPELMHRIPNIPPSFEHRLYIWQFVMERIAERPVIGWGIKSSALIPGGTEIIRENLVYLPLHPHNNLLQMWLELGLLGVGLYVGLIALVMKRIFHYGCAGHETYATLCLCMLTTYLAIAMVGYGVWQNWWVAAGFLLTMLMMGLAPRELEPAAQTEQPSNAPPEA